jgi:hypothetical protein
MAEAKHGRSASGGWGRTELVNLAACATLTSQRPTRAESAICYAATVNDNNVGCEPRTAR